MPEEKLSLLVEAKDAATDTLKKTKDAVKSVGDAVDETKGKTQSMTQALKGLSSAFGTMQRVGAVMTGAVTVGMGLAIKQASDLNESVNAVNVVFGDAAEGVLALGRNAAKATGLSNVQFNSLAVQFSNFASTVAGKGGDVTATMKDLTGRTADFASVMNIDVGDAAALFQSGLAGQTEPLRRYGIDLSAAAVQAYAYSHSIAETGQQLTETQRVQASYALLMESTKKVAGDFANTSDQAANSQRILKAEVADAAAKLGTLYLPMLRDALKAMLPVIEAVSKFTTEHPKATQAIIGTTAAVGGLLLVLGTLGKVVPAVAAGFEVMSKMGALSSAAMKLMTGQATVLQASLAALPLALTIGVALVGFELVMSQISKLKKETDDEYASKQALEDLNQRAIAKAKELRAAGDEEGAKRLLNQVSSNINGNLQARAAGGPVTAGEAYIVGENGPETFVPGGSGKILPNAGASMTFNFYGDVNDKEQLKKEIIQAINRRSALAAAGA